MSKALRYIFAATAFLLAQASVSHALDPSSCDSYAREATKQFQLMEARPACVRAGDARWQPNYNNHYNWCLRAPRAWVGSESKARDSWLLRCGAWKSF